MRAFSSAPTVAYTWGAGKSRDVGATLKLQGGSTTGFGPEQLSPARLEAEGIAGIAHMAFGRSHAALVDGSGHVFTWGVGAHHELGLGEAVDLVETPTRVPGLEEVVQVECGTHHTMALTADGQVYTWGKGGSFFTSTALGQGGTEDSPLPVQVMGLPDRIVQVASGSMHCVALCEDGQVYTWGRGEFGVLGTGGSSDYQSPVLVDAIEGMVAVKVACGSNFTALINADGQLYVWGRNDSGQLAAGDSISMDMYAMEALPTLVEGLEAEGIQVTDVACGDTHTIVCTEDQEVFMWGNKQWLQPNLVRGDDDVMLENRIVQVAAGKNFSAVVDVHGHLFTWGAGKSGCLGHGNKNTLKNPAPVSGFGPAANPDNELGRVRSVFAGPTTIGVVATR